MSNDTNWINKSHTAYDKQLEPLPELESDEAYIERRKAHELELWQDMSYVRDEVVPDNTSNLFVIHLQAAFQNKVAPEMDLKLAVDQLYEDMKVYIEGQAREEIDNEN